ncbi:hypothetical protein BDZ45DRAFT_797666 [Acephala macrosclerotiorum]|nr:hypothetical protein BDZ45DRAFT_797666 [Acephala macrosclerotiorum]
MSLFKALTGEITRYLPPVREKHPGHSPTSGMLYYVHPSWSSCKLAATLVLILASSKDTMFKAMKFQSRSLGGLPTLPQIGSTLSTSFQSAFENAKSVALGLGKKTTVLVGAVELVRAYIRPRGWARRGEHRYRLDEYVECKGAKPRTWEEVEVFVGDFEQLLKIEGRLSGESVVRIQT